MKLVEKISLTENHSRQAFAVNVAKRLREAGFEALWAGGCVRDLLLGIEPTDYDVATNATPDDVRSLFRRSLSVGASFGVVVVQGSPETGDIEVATFRSDGEYLDGRRPASVQYCDARNDALRRDFTINGMFFDPFQQEVIDYVGGQDDLQQGVLRAIREPLERFREDKLRLLRAIRFAARFGLKIETNTLSAVQSMAGQINVVSIERVAQEFHKMLPHVSRVEAMRLLQSTGLLQVLIPELTKTIGLPQNKPAHPNADLWEHTLKVMELLPGKPSFTLAFAALLHDIGKPDSLNTDHGKTTFYGHEIRGRDIALKICHRWKLSSAEIRQIGWLVEYHQYLGKATQMKESKLKRILAEPGIGELLDLHEADALASTGDTGNIDYCRYYLREQPQGPINPPLLFTGHDLAKLGMRPGPLFKTILDRIREAQLDRQIESKKDANEMAISLFSELSTQNPESNRPDP